MFDGIHKDLKNFIVRWKEYNVNQSVGKLNVGSVVQLPGPNWDGPLRCDYLMLFTLKFGKSASYIKIKNKSWEKASYYVIVLDVNKKEIPGSTHYVPFAFVDENFEINVPMSLETRLKEKNKK